MIKRPLFHSHEVNIGGVICGGKAPIRLQSMTTTDTADIEATTNQVIRLVDAGCDYVRITVITLAHVESIKKIKNQLKKKGIYVPIIADVHFSRKVALAVAPFVEKVRVNPGNFTDTRFIKEDSYDDAKYREAFEKMSESFKPLIEICKKHQTAMRIGVNHGSLAGRIMYRYGDTPLGMVASGLEFLDICEAQNFDQIILSMKASCPKIMVEVNRLLVKKMKQRGKFYPIHLGVTEAGDEEAGRLKSAIGIGSLLADGIGNTIRVSLTEAPEKEVPVAKAIVENCTLQKEEKDILWLTDTSEEVINKEKPPINLKQTHVPLVIRLEDRKEEINRKDQDAVLNIQKKLLTWETDKKEECSLKILNDREKATKNQPFLYMWNEDSDDTFMEVYEQIIKEPSCQGIWVSHGDKKTLQVIQRYLIQRKYADDVLAPVYLSSLSAFSGLKKEKGFQGATLWGCFFGTYMIEQLISGFVCMSKEEADLAFILLQAARLRTTVTEYISCPSCGRTLFDLETTTARIKKATSHLPGVKIAVMGCIVNGPGEMADADYGYVGAARGKITLYRGHTVVKKNIDSQEAVNELISLIKEDGLWEEPPGG